MSRLARRISESGVYHILFRGVNQQNIFEEAVDFNKLKETVALVKEDLDFNIIPLGDVHFLVLFLTNIFSSSFTYTKGDIARYPLFKWK